MEYREQRPIYLQIADYLGENVLRGIWGENDRIPSIREMAVETEVNPNTVMRAYNRLQEMGIIYNQRGKGYFVSQDAKDTTKAAMKSEFVNQELPSILRRLEVLGISFAELKQYHDTLQEAGENSENE